MTIGSERVTAPCQTPLVSGRVASRTTPLAYATQRNPQLMVVYSNHTIVTLPAASTASCGFPASTGSTFDESCTIGVQIPFVPWVRVCTSNWRFPVALPGSVSRTQAAVASPAGLITRVRNHRI